MKVHLLHEDRDFDPAAPLPPQAATLIQDLGLGVVLTAMAGGDRYILEVAQHGLLTSLTSATAIAYRQHVLEDCLAYPGVVRQMYELSVEAIERERKVWGWTLTRHPDGVLHHSCEVLTVFVERLRRIAEDHEGMFRSAGFTGLFRMLQTQLDDPYLSDIESHIRRLALKGGELLTARLGEGNKAVGYVLRRPHPETRSLCARLSAWIGQLSGHAQPSAYVYQVPDHDEAGMQALGEIRNQGLAVVATSLGRGADHILGFFRRLRAELAFYVGCLNLRERLLTAGMGVAIPEALDVPPSPGPGARRCMLCARGLYDAALALASRGSVVGSDIDADGRPLVVITGANQGGKTTFHRALGQAQLLMQAGLFVPADAYRATIATALFTHYKREEDPAMKMGKLDEEVSRMSGIVDQVTPGAMLLCNESFSSTNEREGSEIARQIVRGLLEAGVRVVYVTHMYDLAGGWHRAEVPGALFLRAQRLPDGRRTFRIVPGEPLPTSDGPDLYARIFAPEPQVRPLSARE